LLRIKNSEEGCKNGNESKMLRYYWWENSFFQKGSRANDE
jgi:hypothetical protein